MIQFFNEYNQEHHLSLPIKHLGWVHNLILLQQVKDIRARYWYMVQSITSHWSKRYLQEAIKLDDYGKHGALANNAYTRGKRCEIHAQRSVYIRYADFHKRIQ